MALISGATRGGAAAERRCQHGSDTYQSFNCIFVHLSATVAHRLPSHRASYSYRYGLSRAGAFPVVVRFSLGRIAEVRTMGMADSVTSASVGPLFSDARLAATWTPSGR